MHLLRWKVQILLGTAGQPDLRIVFARLRFVLIPNRPKASHPADHGAERQAHIAYLAVVLRLLRA